MGRNRNITPHIVSGDHARAVEAVARSLDIGLPNTTSRRSPVQKKEYVSKLQASGKIVLFCGDGTNDAIALAQANVGVQLGSASDVAGAVADVVLLDVSKRAFVRISFNFVWSAVYNVFAILLAAGAFVKFRIPPAYAGLGEIVSVGPVILAAVSMLAGNGNRSGAADVCFLWDWICSSAEINTGCITGESSAKRLDRRLFASLSVCGRIHDICHFGSSQCATVNPRRSSATLTILAQRKHEAPLLRLRRLLLQRNVSVCKPVFQTSSASRVEYLEISGPSIKLFMKK